MRPRSIMLLALALGCGLVASIGINQYLKARSASPVVPTVGQSAVVVAAQDLDRGTPITEQMVAIREWPTELLSSAAVQEPKEVIGRVAKQKIFAGEPILVGKLDDSGNTRLIPEGMRLVTIKVNTWSAIYGFVQPDDHVDVIMTLRGSNSAENMGKTILENVRVWAVDRNITPEEGTPSSAAVQGVTLLVTPRQAVMLTLAANQGAPLWLSLRANKDDSQSGDTSVTLADMIHSQKEQGPQPERADEDTETAASKLADWLAGSGQGFAGVSESALMSPTWRMKIMVGAHVVDEKEFSTNGRTEPASD